MLIIEHRRLRGEPMRNLHRECLSELIRLMPREHQSFQLRGHFPRYDTRWPANSSTDRGLVNAVSRFDVDNGADLVSFAVPTMMGEVRRHFRDHGWAVKVPRRVKELQPQLISARAELSQRLRRAPTASEIADHLGVGRDLVVEA